MKKRLLELTCILVTLIIVFLSGCNGAQQTSASADKLEVRCNSTAIQWKYSSETEWHDLVALAELRGADGENGKDGVSGKNGTNGKNGTDGRDGKDGKNGLDGTDGADGKNGIDGKTIEVQKTDLYIRWRYENEDWQNLVAIADITGPAGQNGKDGKDGKDGKTPEFRVNENILQWRYSGDRIWLNLYDLSALKGSDGINGQNGEDGKNGKTPFIGKNGNWWIGTTDTGIKAAGTDGKDGINGINGTDGKEIEIQKTESHIQWRYKGGEWQNLVTLSDITGPSGQNGTNGETGKTTEFRVEGNQLQWRYTGDTVWLNLYDLSALKGADGKNGKNGENGTNGKDGKDGRDGKDGLCAGYFSAKGKVSGWNASLPLTVKKESGNLISYNPSGNKITLTKGHTYSLVFSGTVMVSAKSDDKLCGVSLIDGYNSSEMVLETRTYVIMPKSGQTVRLAMAYNTVYTAENDITLTFQYTNMFFQYTDFVDSQYNITVIALD